MVIAYTIVAQNIVGCRVQPAFTQGVYWFTIAHCSNQV